MARDGTNRGGARIGAGRKRKALSERLLEGNEKLEKPQLMFEKTQASFDFPAPKSYLSITQRDGSILAAKQVYNDIFNWLKSCGCAESVNPQLVEDYAQATARHIQAEQEISRAGLIIRHPATGEALPSPLVKISLDYLKAAQQIWYQIYQFTKENGATAGAGSATDTMELILRRTLAHRKGGDSDENSDEGDW